MAVQDLASERLELLELGSLAFQGGDLGPDRRVGRQLHLSQSPDGHRQERQTQGHEDLHAPAGINLVGAPYVHASESPFFRRRSATRRFDPATSPLGHLHPPCRGRE